MTSSISLIIGYSCIPLFICVMHAMMRPVTNEVKTRMVSVIDHDGFSSQVCRHKDETINFCQSRQYMRKRAPIHVSVSPNAEIPIALQGYKRNE